MRLKINSEWRLMQYGLTLTPALLSKEFVEALALFCRFEFAIWKNDLFSSEGDHDQPLL